MKVINVPLNVPNILSLYRLFSFPFIMIFVLIGEKNLFVFFICLNLVTDLADGWIARRFNQVTEIGATLDSLADTGLYFQALAGIFAFKWMDFLPHIISFSIFIGLFILADILPLIKFRKYNSYHTFGAKIGGYIKGAFFFVLFIFGFYHWFYYIMVITGMIAFTESILITIILKESQTDVKGLYWVLKGMKGKTKP
ncbi:MAG TPA: CDP-alcohol phosphatidyltransferase family protein [Ignavibacteria bacterium]